MKLWGGRFERDTNQMVEAFTSSIDFDRRLYEYDIIGSTAHAEMLARCGLVSEREKEAIISGLQQIAGEIREGEFTFCDRLEDIHMHIESRLTEIAGKAGEKLHTARSRNDQIALDLRLYMKDLLLTVRRELIILRKRLLKKAEENRGIFFPGFTHLQPAQPTTVAHHLLAYDQQFARDLERFGEVYGRVDVLPLGSGALAGTTLPVDREFVAERLGFSRVAANTMDAVSDRDFIVEFLAGASLCMMHLSRFCEELIMWASPRFGFVEISDEFCTGSSIMPQKKNPDVAELIRGKTGRIYGDLMQSLTLLKGLPMAYNRDLQEDKESLFDAADTLVSSLAIFSKMLSGIEFQVDAISEAVEEGFLVATDISDYLVEKGIPFRRTHRIVGRLVRHCLEKQKKLDQLELEEFRHFSKAFEADIKQKLDPSHSVQRRRVTGGPAPARTEEYISSQRELLKELQAELGDEETCCNPGT